jgi:hypothetical protein
MYFNQNTVEVDGLFKEGNTHKPHNLLWLGELYKDVNTETLFGGKTKNALMDNKWLIGGDNVAIPNNGNVTLRWTYGDTYYQRYDCLKTYPFTNEDTNQMVEILSFMCETHVNIDGRYDRNRGQIDNTNMSPQNFNLMNDVYTQRDNFFIGRKLGAEVEESMMYGNQIVWSKAKNSAVDVDLWTNITLANSLELDGDKGAIQSLNRLNDQLICFQDTGISQILYNQNVQVSST